MNLIEEVEMLVAECLEKNSDLEIRKYLDECENYKRKYDFETKKEKIVLDSQSFVNMFYYKF